ncbi:hypothetical protein BBP40_000273 [Aspergillus hancockii]|nr:hypothetical protein BBP40_000273 [Aspergillus hancockii]
MRRGYNVTLLKDATAGWSKELTDAATDLVWPLFAQRVLAVKAWADNLREEVDLIVATCDWRERRARLLDRVVRP